MDERVPRVRRWELTTRMLGAALIVAAGVVHLQQYYGVYYRVIPVIGPLFLADFVTAVVIALLLLAPVARLSRPLVTLVTIGGIVFSAGAIVGLEISESGSLFGFHEHGYRLAVVLSVVFEGAAVVLLAVNLAIRAHARGSTRTEAAAYPTHWGGTHTRRDVARSGDRG